jgi:hypothetical protein
VIGWLAIAVVVAATLEGAGWVFLRVMESRHPRLFAFDIEAHVAALDPEYLEAYPDALARRDIHAPDPVLGWIRVPLSSHTFAAGNTMNTDANGSRHVPGFDGPAFVSTYGESFAEGLEVNDDETWQAYLAAAIGKPVWNFAVSGYGPDQSLLALERNLERGLRTPIVILAMINENLNRLMMTYRAFYSAPFPDKFLGFKPIFFSDASGRYEVKTFLPGDLRDRAAIARALHEAARYDGFYPLRTERRGFPFGAHALGFLVRHGPSPRELSLHDSPEAARRMKHVLERFDALSREHDFLPVLLVLPELHELSTRVGRDHELVVLLLSSPLCSRIELVDVVKRLTGPSADEYVPGFDRSRYLEDTHPSAYGDRAIAAVIERDLAPHLARAAAAE